MSSARSIYRLFAAVAAALLLGACTNVAKFDYSAAPGALPRFSEAGSGTKSIAVMPFMDQRGTKFYDPELAALCDRELHMCDGQFI